MGRFWSRAEAGYMPTSPDLRGKIRSITHRMLVWGRDKVPMGVRSLVGVLLCIGGVLGVLPVLGFWMLPLGLAFIALDVPPLRSRIDGWILRLERDIAAAPADPPTTKQS